MVGGERGSLREDAGVVYVRSIPVGQEVWIPADLGNSIPPACCAIWTPALSGFRWKSSIICRRCCEKP